MQRIFHEKNPNLLKLEKILFELLDSHNRFCVVTNIEKNFYFFNLVYNQILLFFC
jgi:hypothetical protein